MAGVLDCVLVALARLSECPMSQIMQMFGIYSLMDKAGIRNVKLGNCKEKWKNINWQRK